MGAPNKDETSGANRTSVSKVLVPVFSFEVTVFKGQKGAQHCIRSI